MRVVIVIEQGAQRGFSVAHPVDRISGDAQPGTDAVAEQRIVFNQQDSQY